MDISDRGQILSPNLLHLSIQSRRQKKTAEKKRAARRTLAKKKHPYVEIDTWILMICAFINDYNEL